MFMHLHQVWFVKGTPHDHNVYDDDIWIYDDDIWIYDL
jgi:hypothetical protein